jgi:transcriptional regulator with XRE-family HTH domain
MTEYADPPQMTDAEFRVARESLGLSGEWLAGYLQVEAATLHGWERGLDRVPDAVRAQLKGLERQTTRFVDAYVEKLLDQAPLLVTYRSDEDYHAAIPDSPFPASWHRAVIGRVAREIPDLTIVFLDKPIA